MNKNAESLKSYRLGIFFLYMISFLWGSGFIAQKILVEVGIPPFYMIGIRMLFTILLLLNLFYEKVFWPIIYKGMIMGGIIFLVFSLQTYGLKTIDTSISSFITSLHLLWTPIINQILFKSKISKYSIIAILIGLIGIYFLNITNGVLFSLNIGFILTLLCSLVISFQFICADHFLKKESPIQLAMFQNLFCCLYAFIFAFFIDGINNFPLNWTWTSGVAICYLGFISSMLCFCLLCFAQKYVKNLVKISLIMATQPIITTFMAVLLLGEILTTVKVVGMFFIIVAIFIEELSISKPYCA